MNITMQQPFSYPFYMDRTRAPVSIPWSSTPFVYPQQRDLLPRKVPPTAPFSNARYHHIKQSSRHSHRRSNRHSSYHDAMQTQQYRPSKTTSTSDFGQLSQSSSAHLLKAHSWHTMANQRPSNLSVGYAKEMNLTPKSRRRYSPQKKKPISPQRRLPTSPKRKASFRKHRKRPIHLPERGVVRISTLDEMPIPNHHHHHVDQRTNSINMDRISKKGSISNSSKRRIKPKEKSKADSRSIQSTTNDDNETAHIDSDTQSSASNYSISSLQQRLNGSLRNDPLISAAIEEYRDLQRSSSQTTTLTSHHHNLSRDSLRSNSTIDSSSSLSDNHSQSSFTSLERSEIRQLIKTIKTKDTKSLNNPLHSSPPPTPSEEYRTISSPPPIPIAKTRKSSLTEELDREFNKIRALDPDQEINCVTPSSICRRKKTLEKPVPSIPPLPTFDELLRQVQLRPVDKSPKPVHVKEKLVDEHYENPLLSVPVPVPRSSPIPVEENKIEEPKHEYAVPNKRSRAQISYFQPGRNYKFTPSIPSIRPSKRTSRSLSMLNWLQSNLANPFPATFQPNPMTDYPIEYGTTSVKENIYASNIDVYSQLPTIDKIHYDESPLQIHLDNQTILTDDFYSEFETKQTDNSLPTILDDFSHLFTRKHKLHKKSQRCSIM